MDKWVIRSTKEPANKPTEPSASSSGIKRKSIVDRDKQYDKKRVREFQDSWNTQFPWINAEDQNNVFCKVCRAYPQLADKSSSRFVGKKLDRKDTLQTHSTSAKHIACFSKQEKQNITTKKTGAIEKAFSKVEQSEVERYKKLFNTAYAVAKHNRPFTDFAFTIVVNGSSSRDFQFDPLPAVESWLASGNRHKKPVKIPPTPAQEEPGSSGQAAVNTDIQPMLAEGVKVLGGEEAARESLNPCLTRNQDSAN